MHKSVALLMAVAAMVVGATDREYKAKVIASLETKFAGTAEVTCDEVGGWKFEVKTSVDEGRDVLTVKISSPTEAVPPKFGVFFKMSGAGVQNVWCSNSNKMGYQLWPKLWWPGNSRYHSSLGSETPVVVGFNSVEVAPVALACSDAFNHVVMGLYADDRTCELTGRCEFFMDANFKLKEYTVSVMFDRRGRGFADTVRDSSKWVAKANGFVEAHVPEAAFDPLYSTWYAYLQDVYDKPLEEEARQAAALGMKTMILDDGWQKVDSKTFYSAVGDWMPAKERFPDMKTHVAAVHKAGLKYMLWLSVPFVGEESQAFKRFQGKFLSHSKRDMVAIFDPRFPEVREYLINTYERVVRDWGFDGVKLDFIDSFSLPAKDPAEAENFAGRDYRDVPSAVDRLMRDVNTRLKAINPEVLIEFRQHYMGPAILQYGNMMRCADCPADPVTNRKRICDLRLTSGSIAVHSDMLVWSAAETPEGAALPILNALFGTIQYSMILANINPAHKDVIRHWLKFSQEHREALLKGKFTPHHPENVYPWIESESATERIIAAYSADACVKTGARDKRILLVNATGTDAMTVDAAQAGAAKFFDVFGREAGTAPVKAGLQRLAVPRSGYAVIE